MTWSPRGLLSSVTLTRQSVTGAPGLAWHVDQLAKLRVARLLPRLSVALFAGPAPGRAEAGEDPDALAADVLTRLAALEGAPALRSVSLGFVSQPRAWPKAELAWQALKARAPHLEAWKGAAPPVSCTLHRSSDGQWVVFDEHADPFRLAHGRLALRVNGQVTARATLAPGDVVEPVEGLRFLFNFASD